MKPFLYFRLLCVLLLTLFCFSSSQPLCHDDERTWLLQFKESFIIDKSASGGRLAYPKVSFWTSHGGTSDCCLWDGVECDEDTGYVISLNLSSSCLYGSIDSNSSLFNLVHLQRLNLAHNNFNYSQIPTAIKRLSMLTYLNLSASVFSGQIPSEVSELSRLSYLDLSLNADMLSDENLLELKTPNLESLIFNLTSLEQLHLSYVDILSTVPNSLSNFSSLTSLLLSGCGLKGEFPIRIFELPNLRILDVGYNEDLSGKLPSFKQISPLKVLKLDETRFSGELPASIEKLVSLTELSALHCNFSGVIPFSIGKLGQLNSLDLSENNLRGQIPSSMANLTQLTDLQLYSNHLNGLVPVSFSKLINLEALSLYDNNLSGTLNFDMFLGLKNLDTLLLSNNNLSVLIKPSSNGTFPQFTILKLSYCNLGSFPDFLRHQERISYLSLQGNHIGDRIPEWMFNISRKTLFQLYLSDNSLIGQLSPAICNLSSLAILKLSNNKLEGNLPQCLTNLGNSLSLLSLKNNFFSGNIPAFTKGSQLKLIDLNHNQLQGNLPRSLTNCRMLGYLNLGYNNLSDVFPYWLGTLPELEVLVLRSNGFHGVVGEPNTNVDFPKLRIIDISYNNFSGKLPSKYIQSWKAMKNSHVGNLSYMSSQPIKDLTSSVRLRYYFTITIEIKGVNRNYDVILEAIAVVDLSNNKFDGEILEVIGSLRGLYSIDLSNNNLTGLIPSSLGNLTELESLDLSQNKLSGEIPQELSQLTFLQYFNVSHNHLTGPIPQENQLSTFDSSSYEGNLGLCGIPLPNKCGNSDASDPPLPSYEEEQEESSSFFQFGWKAVVIGYGCGFLVGLLIGQIVIAKKSRWFAMTFGVKNLQVRRL